MTEVRTLIAASILICFPVSVVFAQADRTGVGDGSLSTEKAHNTTIAGQTKPPNRDVRLASVEPAEQLTPLEAADDAISRQICIGCVPEPSKIGSLTVPVPVVTPPERGDAQLEELLSAPPPKQQSDLDTVALASAHREKAKSMEEKTNGLWQSWLVSICNGCSDQKPPLKIEDWPSRDVPLTTGSVNLKASSEKSHHLDVKQTVVHHRHYGSLEADLSPENVDSIRRTPQR